MTYLLQALKKYFGYDSFREGQEKIIADALTNRDLLVIMPTGGGKSLCFQLSALLRPGVTIVVSPLISLMQDQVLSLQEKGINATYINSTLTPQEIRNRQKLLLSGKCKLLYLAPERLVSNSFQGFLNVLANSVSIASFVIDEAHCISEWGHDFRQEYRQLQQLRHRYPHTPIMALTATATPRVQQDIICQLQLRNPIIHRFSFNRPNLYYQVIPKERPVYPQLFRLVNSLQGAGIIYCLARKTTEDLAYRLQRDGIPAVPYHAGLSDEIRTHHQHCFLRDEVRIIVATVAFGMGINKPNVRFVIHHDLPRNLESYYQESGRAGRDGNPATCILLYSPQDEHKIRHFIRQKNTLKEQKLAIQQFLKVKEYVETPYCRRTVQLEYFGEKFRGNCGACDNCLTPKNLEDWTVEAQKFLSCVARTGERFGITHIINILRGEQTKKIYQYGHHLLPTYGIGRDISRIQWEHLARGLIYQGFLNKTNDGYNILKLNSESWQILRGNKRVKIFTTDFPKRQTPRPIPKEALPIPLPTSSQMKTLQLHQQGLDIQQIARKRGIKPATVVEHLCELLRLNQPVDLNRIVRREKQELIRLAREKLGSKSLRILREFLGENYSDDEIKLVMAWCDKMGK